MAYHLEKKGYFAGQNTDLFFCSGAGQRLLPIFNGALIWIKQAL
jgi:hypothetical protein